MGWTAGAASLNAAGGRSRFTVSQSAGMSVRSNECRMLLVPYERPPFASLTLAPPVAILKNICLCETLMPLTLRPYRSVRCAISRAPARDCPSNCRRDPGEPLVEPHVAAYEKDRSAPSSDAVVERV